MAKKHSHRHSRRHKKTNCRGGRHPMNLIQGGNLKQRGGAGWTSASTYGMAVNGPLASQITRTFSTTGPYADRVGSEYVGAQGQWAKQPNTPSAQNLSLIQSAGNGVKKGGFLGPVISQAIVPATILGMQQTYRRRGHSNNRSVKHRRFSRRR